MIQIQWYMTGMMDGPDYVTNGEADMGILPFATEGEAAAYEEGVRSAQAPAGTEYKFETELEGRWFDAGRSNAKSCLSNGHGIHTVRVGGGNEIYINVKD